MVHDLKSIYRQIENQVCTLDEAVLIWSVPLLLEGPLQHELEAYLSIDELERSKRFANDTSARLYRNARGWLRCLLAHYNNQKPQELRFQYGENGKPALDEPHQELQFSLAHSGIVALVAMAKNHAVGVDLEHIKVKPSLDTVAKRFFLESEYQLINAAAEHEKALIFYRYWTCKEACIKAEGGSLFAMLSRFEFDLTNADSHLVKIENNHEAAKTWTVRSFQPVNDFMGAVAIRAPNCSIQMATLSL